MCAQSTSDLLQEMPTCRRSLASRVLRGVTSRVEVHWEEVRRLPKHLSASSLALLEQGKEGGKRLRSRSCERVLRRCRGLGRVVRGKESPLPDTFQASATLRRSRRSRGDKARPARRIYSCYARAVEDYTPSPYDTEALPLRAGDLIGVIHKVGRTATGASVSFPFFFLVSICCFPRYKSFPLYPEIMPLCLS